jgi:hypothetical protein
LTTINSDTTISGNINNIGNALSTTYLHGTVIYTNPFTYLDLINQW